MFLFMNNRVHRLKSLYQANLYTKHIVMMVLSTEASILEPDCQQNKMHARRCA